MLAILVSLALLIVLTFRKINIVVVGIAAAAVMALLSGQPVVTAVTDTYMTGAAQFVRDNFLLFFFSVLFGKVMEETGCLLYTSPSPRDVEESRMPSSA